MPVDILPDRVTLCHPTGSSTTILFYGATVISWLSPASQERLFVSSLASLDGSKPVRGGIPICWPIFGPPSREEYKSLKQHGFARSVTWKYDGTVLDDAAGVSGRFVLESNEETMKVFPYPFKLAYTVTLAEHQLTTSLRVTNPGSIDLIFQALLHNYFRGEAASAEVKGVTGTEFWDKANGGVRGKEEREVVDVKVFTDRVYESAGSAYTLHFPSTPAPNTLSIKTQNMPDVTVWNPQETGSSMADMEPKGWDNYVCVEPGHVREFVSLGAGEEWFGQQVLTVV